VIDGWQDVNKNGRYLDSAGNPEPAESDAVKGFYNPAFTDENVANGRIKLHFVHPALVELYMQERIDFEQGNGEEFNKNTVVFNRGSLRDENFRVEISPSYCARADKETYQIDSQRNSFEMVIQATVNSRESGTLRIFPTTPPEKSIKGAGQKASPEPADEREFITSLIIRPPKFFKSFFDYTTAEMRNKATQIDDNVGNEMTRFLCLSPQLDGLPYAIGRVLITNCYKPGDLKYSPNYQIIMSTFRYNGFICDLVDFPLLGNGAEPGWDSWDRDVYKRVKPLISDREYLLWIAIEHNDPPEKKKSFCVAHASAEFWEGKQKVEGYKIKVETIHSVSCYSAHPGYTRNIAKFLKTMDSCFWVGYEKAYKSKWESIDVPNWVNDWIDKQNYRHLFLQLIPRFLWSYLNDESP